MINARDARELSHASEKNVLNRLALIESEIRNAAGQGKFEYDCMIDDLYLQLERKDPIRETPLMKAVRDALIDHGYRVTFKTSEYVGRPHMGMIDDPEPTAHHFMRISW